MSNRFSNPASQYFDSSGNPYIGGFLHFYITTTSTPTDTYSNPALTIPNTNPIELDTAGRLPDDVFLDPAVTYKVVLTDASGVEIWSRDPVTDPAANVTSAFRVYAGDPNGSVAGSAGSVGGSSASVLFDIVNRVIWVCTTTGSAPTAVWTQMGSNLTGTVSFSSVVSPPALAADQNNYAPVSFSTAAHLRQDSSADVAITGLDAGTAGRMLVWTNISATYAQTLKAENTSSTAANRFALQGDLTVEPGQSVWLWYDTTTARWRAIGGASANMLGDPGGRLCISTGEAVATSDLTAKTTVYYTPHKHNYAKLYNGGAWYPVQFSELSQTLADNSKSPAAATNNSVYDMFLWNDAGTLRCTRGPAWNTSTARGTGAGTTEIARVDGIYLNKYDIANGPAANRGLFVGTICTDGSTQLNVMLAPAAAAGGSNNRVDIWNMFNRVHAASTCRDSTNTWTYTTLTFRSLNGSNSNRITFACGINEDAIRAVVVANASSTTADPAYAAIGLNSVTVQSGLVGTISVNGGAGNAIGSYAGLPGLGRRFVQALEASTAAGTTTWYGDNGSTFMQSGIQLHWTY